MPIIVGVDGVCRICDLSLAFSSMPVAAELAVELRLPNLLPARDATLLRARMLRGLVPGAPTAAAAARPPAEAALPERSAATLRRVAGSAALRALVTAIAFRDHAAARFWRIAAAAGVTPILGSSSHGVAAAADAAAVTSAVHADAMLALPPCYGLCQAVHEVTGAELRFLGLVAYADDTASACGVECETSEPSRLRSELTRGLLRLGEKTAAIAVLLDHRSRPSGRHATAGAPYRRPASGAGAADAEGAPRGGGGGGARAAAGSFAVVEPCVPMSSWLRLKACVVAAAVGPEALEDAVAHVSADLLDDQLDEAVDLMCVVGRQFEACLLLQQSGKWRRAAVIARTTLPRERCGQIWTRWADHMVAAAHAGHVAAAAEALAACARWEPLVSLLHERGDAEGVERACILADWLVAPPAADASDRTGALRAIGLSSVRAAEIAELYDQYLVIIGAGTRA